MKNILYIMALAAIVLTGSSAGGNKIMAAMPAQTGKDTTRPDVAERQENDFLRESKTDPYAYEFTKSGDYRFIITEVYTPAFDFLNFCLDGSAITLNFEDRRIICPEVKNEFRCITGLRNNLSSNEYVVKGIKAGALIKAWPSNPAMVLKRNGIHCTNNKFNCNLYGPQAEWDNDGYKLKVMVLRYRQ